MKYFIVGFLLSLICTPSMAQEKEQSNDHDAIRQVVIDLFDGMRAQDSSKLMNCFADGARLLGAAQDKDGQSVLRSTEMTDFVGGVLKAKGRYLDEQITSWNILQDGNLASVWTDYLLYVDGNFIHCGVDAFQMVRLNKEWKITQITDTRRKENCVERPEDHLQAFLNRWHNAASTADSDTFFGSMTEDGIYIGTDATERWKRDELKEWSKKYFEREKAWDFKTKSRQIELSEDGRTAWFDEILDTWMGDCRGSGVLTLTNDGWKIKHYHLAMAVPNDVIDEYLELLKKGE